MPAKRKTTSPKDQSSATIGFEAKLWLAADMARFVLANGSMASNQSGEGDIRRPVVEADLVDCMVVLFSHN